MKIINNIDEYSYYDLNSRHDRIMLWANVKFSNFIGHVLLPVFSKMFSMLK